MAECAQCMFDNPDGATACEQCGADLVVEALSMQLGAVCRTCDSYNDPGVRNCFSCGTPLGKATDSEPPPIEPDEVLEETPVGQPWLASPDSGRHKAPTEDDVAAVLGAAPSRAIPASPSAPSANVTPSRAVAAPLPPGALPPGWAAFQQRQPPPRSSPPPTGAVPCARCQSENPPTARFCGSCGHPLQPQPGLARARAKLILIRGIAGEGRQYPLAQAQNAAGRTDGVVTFPEDPYVAGLHATFLFRGEDLLVRDEGAGNGIYVRLREPQTLRPGDMFVVGERLLRFAGPAPAAPPVPGRHGAPRAGERLLALEELLEGGGVGRVCRRAGPIITIGRAGCDLNFPADGFVSARHAELSIAGETAFLRDLGSANGTFLRVQPKAERRLNHGDYLLVGRELLRVEVAASR